MNVAYILVFRSRRDLVIQREFFFIDARPSVESVTFNTNWNF